MYQIAICDDETHMQEQLTSILTEILEERNIPFRCRCYGNLEECYRDITEHGEAVHLLLLDILMKNEENGMDFAVRLRESQVTAGIIFITSSIDYVLRGYDVQAIKYLIKPVDKKELEKAVLYNYETCFKQQYVLVHQERHPVSIRVKDILFAEITGKKTTVMMTDGTQIVCRERLSELAEGLPAESFCFCHRSFLINLEHVSEISRYRAAMSDGSLIPISKSCFKSTQDAFMKRLAGRFR